MIFKKIFVFPYADAIRRRKGRKSWLKVMSQLAVISTNNTIIKFITF